MNTEIIGRNAKAAKGRRGGESRHENPKSKKWGQKDGEWDKENKGI